MKQKKFKSILACVLVLSMVFSVQSVVFATEVDDTVTQESSSDIVTDMADVEDDADSTDTTTKDDETDDTVMQESSSDVVADMADETDTTDDTTGIITDGTKDTDTTGEEVSTEDTLKSAISSATGTAESPTVIAITSDIELSTPLVIEDGKHIMLIGASDFINYESNFKIKPALTYVSGDSVNFITLGANSSVTVKNITLDADYKGRVVSIGENASFTMDKGAWITRGGLPEDSTVKLSGAGLYSWSDNAVITINGGKISNCRVNGNGTGGGICLGINSDKLNMTDGLIEENTHSGVYIVKGVSGSITGGKITKNDMGVFLNTASLSFGGSIDISGNGTETAPQNLFINQGASDKVLTIGSALENDLFFYGINGYYYNKPSTKIAQGTDNYTLTQSDFEHLKYDSGHGYVYKTVFDKDNNQILNGKHYYLSYNSRQKGDDSENNEVIYKYFPADETATVDGTIFEREGCVVSYYLIGSDKYNVGDTLSFPQSNGYTLNAVWEKDIPVKNGFIFDGWYEQDGSATGIWGKSIEPAIVKDGTTYYAKWEEKEASTISFNGSLNLDKVYNEQAVSITTSDYTVTGDNREVVFSYQVKDGNDWKDIDTAPINAGTYRVKAVVEENDTHKSAESDWKKFTISKATPTYTVPTNLTATVGNTLADVKLPTGFTWQDVATTSVGTAGTHTFMATYTPSDTENYNSVSNIVITVIVYPKMEVVNEVPVIKAEDKTLTVGDTFDAKADVTATDKEDGNLTDKIEVIKNTVDTSKAGTYEVTYKVTDSQGASCTKTITVTVNPKMEVVNEVPVIKAEDKTLTVGDTFDAKVDVTATDKEDGNLTDKIEVIKNTVDTSKAGTYEVTYKVTDSQGASCTKTITVIVKEKDTQNPPTDDNKKPSVSDKDKKPTNTEKPTSNSPKTGDNTNMTLWGVLVILSGGLLAVVTGMKRKRKFEK